MFILSPEAPEVIDLLGSASTDWHPLVLIPGALASKEILENAAGVQDRLFLSFPTLPLDQTREGIAEYERLAAAHGLPRGIAHPRSRPWRQPRSLSKP